MHVRRVHHLPLRVAFVVATCAFVFVFATAGAPIPLFNTYRAEDGITKGDLAMVSVAYFVAAATSLLLLGRLSNHIGRRPVAIAALALAALSCVVLIGTHGLFALLAARGLQGLACGLAPGAIGAYVVESAPARPRWLPALITGSAPMLGIPLGALGCGALVEHAPAPRVLVYVITAAVLTICTVLVGLSPETTTARGGAIASLRPRLQVPLGSARLLVTAGAAFVATWSLGGFYQAFGASLAAEYLGTTSPLVAATVFSSVMILNPVGGPVSARLSPSSALRFGMAAFVVALAGILVSLRLGAFVPLVAASLLVGCAQGVASTAGVRGLLSTVASEERAGLLATLYLVGYSGAAVPGMIAGRLAGRLDIFHIFIGYGVLGTAAAIVAMIAARNTTRKEKTS